MTKIDPRTRAALPRSEVGQAGGAAAGLAGAARASTLGHAGGAAAPAEERTAPDRRADRRTVSEARGRAVAAEGSVRARVEGKAQGGAAIEGRAGAGVVEQAPTRTGLPPDVKTAMAPTSGDADEQRDVARQIELQGGRPDWRGQKAEDIYDAREDRLRKANDELRREIEGLKPGEKLVTTSSGELNVQVPRVKGTSVGVEVGDKTTVEKTQDGTYKVSHEDSLEGGVSVGIDGKGGKEEGPSAKVAGRVGSETNGEYEFKTLDDATRGARILRRGGPENDADREFLEQHRVSEERVSKASLTGGVSVATQAPGVKLEGGFEGKSEAQDFVKLNYKKNPDGSLARDKDGNKIVESVEYGTRSRSSLTGKGTIKVEGPGGSGGVNVDTGGRTSGEVEVTRSTTVKVPEGVDQAELQRDPLGTLAKHPPDPDYTSSQTKVVVRGETQVPVPDGTTRSVKGETETVVRGNQPEKNLDGSPATRQPTVSSKNTTATARGSGEGYSFDLIVVEAGAKSHTDKVGKPTETRLVDSPDYGDLTS